MTLPKLHKNKRGNNLENGDYFNESEVASVFEKKTGSNVEILRLFWSKT